MNKLIGKHPSTMIIIDDSEFMYPKDTKFKPESTILRKDLLDYCTKYIAANTYQDKESYREQVVLNDIIRKFCI